MMTWSRTLAAQLLCCILAPAALGCPVSVIDPVSGDMVIEEQTVTGTTARAKGEVWVVVHPLPIASYYVQQMATADKSGAWQTWVHFGVSDTPPSTAFELMAFGGLRQILRVGQILPRWPRADCSSDLVRVSRQ